MNRDLIRRSADLPHRPGDDLPVLTTDDFPGQRVVEVLGIVRGNTIRTRHLGHDIIAAFKSLAGGEIGEYTKLMAEAREQSLDRMRAEAVDRGANAVVGARFTTSMVLNGAAEILVYGTAVRVEPVGSGPAADSETGHRSTTTSS